MRITGGTYGGRILKSPKDNAIRPTSDKVRLAIFNILNARGLVQDAHVLDAFCGTGALGIEALSHGALCCTFMDKNHTSLDLARDNFAALKIDAQHSFVLKDTTKPGVMPNTMDRANLVFLDPPYNQGLIAQSLSALIKNGWIEQGAHILCEAESAYNGFELIEIGCNIVLQRQYGDTQIIILEYGINQQ